MLVSRCPECGKPAPVSLQHPERLQCLHCGYDGLPSAEARPYLQTALGVLQKLHVRHRQLTNLQKRALDSSWGALIGYLAFAIPVLVPFLCCGVLGAVMIHREPGNFLLPSLCCVMPGLGMSLGAFAGFAYLRWSRRRLKAIVVAVPPANAGEAARCHLCGAGLEGEAHHGFLRCSFCGSDNLVTPGVMKEFGHRSLNAIEGVGEQLHFHAQETKTALRQIRVGLIGSALLTPFIAFAVTCLALPVVSSVPVLPFESVRYTLISGDAQTCVVSLRDAGSGLRIDGRSVGRIPVQGYYLPADISTFGWRGLRTLRVLDASHGASRVARVFGALGVGENRVELSNANGTTFELDADNLCVDPRGALPVVPIPASHLQTQMFR